MLRTMGGNQSNLTYGILLGLANANSLSICGAFHPLPDDDVPAGTETIVLLGPNQPEFWHTFKQSREYKDDGPDAMDRWSQRVVGQIADNVGAVPLFPFGGPPYRPFIKWALRSHRSWQSPVTLLVHDEAGLFVSYRGALAIRKKLALPKTGPCPCDSCPEKPCVTACPASALNDAGYDLAACHAYLETTPGHDCMENGCAVRRACPVSQSYGRQSEQSAFHMKAFHQ